MSAFALQCYFTVIFRKFCLKLLYTIKSYILETILTEPYRKNPFKNNLELCFLFNKTFFLFSLIHMSRNFLLERREKVEQNKVYLPNKSNKRISHRETQISALKYNLKNNHISNTNNNLSFFAANIGIQSTQKLFSD